MTTEHSGHPLLSSPNAPPGGDISNTTQGSVQIYPIADSNIPIWARLLDIILIVGLRIMSYIDILYQLHPLHRDHQLFVDHHLSCSQHIGFWIAKRPATLRQYAVFLTLSMYNLHLMTYTRELSF